MTPNQQFIIELAKALGGYKILWCLGTFVVGIHFRQPWYMVKRDNSDNDKPSGDGSK